MDIDRTVQEMEQAANILLVSRWSEGDGRLWLCLEFVGNF
jgi:hypothetical protein